MSRDGAGNGRDHKGHAIEAVPPPGGRGWLRDSPMEPDGRPQLRVRLIERTALVRLINAEILFEEQAVREVGDQLDRLVAEGHTRLLLNLGGVRTPVNLKACLIQFLVPLGLRLRRAGVLIPRARSSSFLLET